VDPIQVPLFCIYLIFAKSIQYRLREVDSRMPNSRRTFYLIMLDVRVIIFIHVRIDFAHNWRDLVSFLNFNLKVEMVGLT
jgi:hypothetical protein